VPSIETLLKVAAAVEVPEGRLLDGIDWIPNIECGRGAFVFHAGLNPSMLEWIGDRMAEGIRRRHPKGCPAKHGKRCTCNAGWEASLYLEAGGRRITKTFSREAEAKSWRADALRARDRGELRATPWDGRTLAEALRRFIAGVEAGAVRPKGRARYKPNTSRSYERVVRVYIDPSRVSGLKVPQIRRRDLQELADELLGSGLSASTVSNIFNPLQAFYRRAVDRDELTSRSSGSTSRAGPPSAPSGSPQPRKPKPCSPPCPRTTAQSGQPPSTPDCGVARSKRCASATSTSRRM
jgi:hypothetical protein